MVVLYTSNQHRLSKIYIAYLQCRAGGRWQLVYANIYQHIEYHRDSSIYTTPTNLTSLIKLEVNSTRNRRSLDYYLHGYERIPAHCDLTGPCRFITLLLASSPGVNPALLIKLKVIFYNNNYIKLYLTFLHHISPFPSYHMSAPLLCCLLT